MSPGGPVQGPPQRAQETAAELNGADADAGQCSGESISSALGTPAPVLPHYCLAIQSSSLLTSGSWR